MSARMSNAARMHAMKAGVGDRYRVHSTKVHSDCGTHARGIVLIGVFDGHGRRGEHISTQLASAVRMRADGLCDELDQIMQRQACSDWQQCQALISGVLYTLSNLLETSLDRRDAPSGGSTAVICIVAPESYSITANVGDSRAVAVRVSNADILKLTRDHDMCRPPGVGPYIRPLSKLFIAVVARRYARPPERHQSALGANRQSWSAQCCGRAA